MIFCLFLTILRYHVIPPMFGANSMTVNNQISVVEGPGNGSAFIFSFSPMVINKATDIVVIHKDALGVETTIPVGTGPSDYSLSVSSFPGIGSVVFPADQVTPMPSGESIFMVRTLVLEQKTKLNNQGGYNPKVQEQTYDIGRMIDIQQQELIDRSLKVSLTDTSGADFTIPDPVADTVIGVWDPTASAIITGPTANDIANAQGNAAAAAASATAADASATSAAASAAAANASALGFSKVVTLTTGTTNIEIADSKAYYILDTSGGTVTVNLPSIGSDDGINYKFERVGSNAADIVPDGTDTVNGVAATYSIASDTEVVQFISNDDVQDDWIANVQSQTIAGDGLSKSGSTMNVDIAQETSVTVASGDELLVADASDSSNIKKVTAQGIADLSADDFLHIQDQKSSGTAGGAFTAGSYLTRDLNTVLTNEISGASLASDQITLPAGDYYIEATVPAYKPLNHKAQLFDTTGTAILVVGTSEISGSGDATSTRSLVSGNFTLSEESDLEVRHRGGSTRASDGFGVASSFGEVEVYTDVKIWTR